MAYMYDYLGNEIKVEETTDLVKKFKGKNIVILADSIFDYEIPDGFNIGFWIKKNIEANVLNWAQGGCCMAKGKATNYDPYSFVGLADALATHTFTDQEEYATDRNFSEQVDEMKNFDMSKADYLIVAYGTNDFWRNGKIEDSDEGYDTSTYIGAFKYGIKTLLTKYPKLKIVCLGIQNLGSLYIDSGGYTIYSSKYNEAIKKAAYDLAVPFVDIWSDSMINTITSGTLCDGQPHLSHEGKLRYAALVENALNYYY